MLFAIAATTTITVKTILTAIVTTAGTGIATYVVSYAKEKGKIDAR